MSDAEHISDNSVVESKEMPDGQADPMTKPSVEQPEAPTPGGEDEEAIQLDPPLPNSSDTNPSDTKEK